MGQGLTAIQRRQRLHDLDDLEAREPVIDVFAVAARGHQAFVAQDAQVLRQAGLVQADQHLELADVAFALGQLTEQQQAVFVGHGLEHGTGLGRGIPQHVDGMLGQRSGGRRGGDGGRSGHGGRGC